MTQPGSDVPAEQPTPLRSIHTINFPGILNQMGASLLATTYQAGKLVVVRPAAEEPNTINTHFRTFNRPMGMAVRPNRLAIGTSFAIWEFHNIPAVAAKLRPHGKHDACYLPRRSDITGDVQIHEMGYCHDELWFANTRFSCLCTNDREHSFVPRWRPKFVSQLVPHDRCHLNGLGLVDGEPRYVTALGETDSQGGWRENKKDGGILIDVKSNEIITRQLSMPHSPRWYDGRLWLAESGTGGFGFVDLQTGKYESIVELPGFTRGIDFWGNLAFIGLSQVRETAVFSGIPITEKMGERNCGVWVVDLTAGQTVAFLKFKEGVEEIFAVSVLPGLRFPDVINDQPELIRESFVLPHEALSDVPERLRPTAVKTSKPVNNVD